MLICLQRYFLISKDKKFICLFLVEFSFVELSSALSFTFSPNLSEIYYVVKMNFYTSMAIGLSEKYCVVKTIVNTSMVSAVQCIGLTERCYVLNISFLTGLTIGLSECSSAVV